MITFLDGPAAGQTLMLKRIPVLLRVVQDLRDEWDALDQLDDRPDPNERITVYLRDDATPISTYHLLCGRGAKTATGWYFNAGYRLFDKQPADADARTTARWQAWAAANAPPSKPITGTPNV